MFLNRHIVKHYRALSIASLIAGGSLLPLVPALADQNSPTPGTLIENQATAQFTDAADGTEGKIVSDKVSVTVAEVAGIAASNVGVLPSANGGAYRTNTVYFDFYVTNTGNDPTRLFVPGAPSAATIAGTALLSGSIGAVEVIAYNPSPIGTGTEVTITGGNTVPAGGAATGTGTLPLTAASGAPVAGSIPAGGYIKVRVPITVPLTATTGQTISVTLGNATGQPDPATSAPVVNFTATQTATNILYAASGNDLYTQDNPDSAANEASGTPLSVRETSITQTATVIDPPIVTISGRVWDDRNKSANGNFSNIFTTGEFGTNGVFGTNTTPINVILVNTTTGLVIANKTLTYAAAATDNGAYSFPGVQAITDVRIFLSDKVGVVGSTPPAAPTTPAGATTISSLGWVGTSPISKIFTTGLVNSPNNDFGIIQKAKLVLVKRITGMKKSTDLAAAPMRRINPNDGKELNTYINETNPDDDTTMNWPTPAPDNFLIGAVDGGKVSPGDTIEYTIYFLNNQGADATNIRLCDPILSSQTFNSNGYGAGKDMQLQIGTDTVIDLTAANDTTVDRAYAYAAGSAPAIGTCNIPSANQGSPGVKIDLTGATSTNQPALTEIPGATGHGTASAIRTTGGGTNTTLPYGLFRFTTTVKP
jgi:uncharacterized repeat protein (TIGR01451 family)